MENVSRKRALRAHGLLVALAIALCYANSLRGPLLFDDTSPERFRWHTRPLSFLSFELSRAISGQDTWSFHALNVLAHVGCALVLLALLRRCLALAAPSVPERTREGLALATTLVWAVHPLQTESVAYISQRAEALASLFYVAFLYAFVRAATEERDLGWKALALLSLALGMASKEIVSTAPVLAVLLDVTLLAPSGARTWRTRRGFYLALFALWIALVAWFVAGTLFAEEGSSSGFGVQEVTKVDYARSQAGVILHYLRLAFWPHPLCLDYGWPVASAWSEWVPQGIVVLALLGATAVGVFRRSWLGFAGAWFFVVLAPTSSIVPIRDLAFEHRMYLPLAAVVLVVVVGAWRVAARLFPSAPAVRCALAAVVVLALGATTVRRGALYRSPIAMWQDVLAQRPANKRARENLSGLLIQAGRQEEAVKLLEEVLKESPSALAYNNLAAIHMDAGRLDEAMALLGKAIVADPSYDVSYQNMGACHLRRGNYDMALTYFERALARLETAYTHRDMATAYLRKGDLARAEPHLERAVALAPPATAERQRTIAVLEEALARASTPANAELAARLRARLAELRR